MAFIRLDSVQRLSSLVLSWNQGEGFSSETTVATIWPNYVSNLVNASQNISSSEETLNHVKLFSTGLKSLQLIKHFSKNWAHTRPHFTNLWTKWKIGLNELGFYISIM